MPYLAATSLVGSSLRPTRDTTSTPSMFLMPSRCLMPKAPAPASATGIVSVTSVILQDQMAYGGVAGRDVIEAMPDGRRLAAIDVVHGAPGDQPHHQLNTLAARLAHIVDMRHGGESLGIRDQPVEEGIVPLLVDKSGARSLQLMAHAASTPDLDVERLVIGLDGLANRLAEHEAAPPRRRRVLHDIDGERDHRARPRLRLAAHQAERDGEAVMDVHLVDDGQVEIVLDHRLGDMRCQFRMADHVRHRARPPALVSRDEFRRSTDRKGRDDIEAESVGMIIVDEKDHIRLLILEPLFGDLVTLENRPPIRLGGLAEPY